MSVANSGGGPNEQPDTDVVVPIIVILAAEPEDAGIAASRAALMGRLKKMISPEQFAATRTFEMLPAIAMSAEPDLIAWLLTQAEVASIEPDRTLAPLPVVAPRADSAAPTTPTLGDSAGHSENDTGESALRNVAESQPKKDS